LPGGDPIEKHQFCLIEAFFGFIIILEVSILKKRGLGVLIAVVSLVFILSSCVLFKGTAVGKNWVGTVELLQAAGDVATGTYAVSISFKFEWLLGNSKINGGTITFYLPTTGERIGAESYKFNVTTGEYKESDTSLTFKAKEIDYNDILEFTGTVASKAITNGAITYGVLPVGSFSISEQGS